MDPQSALPSASADHGRSPSALRRLGIAAGVLIGAAAVTPSGAMAASGPEYFGTNLQTLFAITPSQQQNTLALLGQHGLTLDRIEVQWKAVEPNAPTGQKHTYQWAGTDALIRRMATAGLRAAPLFRFAPGWVRERDPSKPGGYDELPPVHYADFARMVAAFAARYGEGGDFWAANPGLPQVPVQSYEIWNEVNLAEYAWNADPNPEVYSALLKVIRPALKAVQPSAVMLAALAYQEDEVPDYVPRMAAAGGLDAIDAMGYHPYAPEALETIVLVQRLRAQLRDAGHGDLPIYANEAGQEALVTNPDGTTVPAGVAPAQWAWQQFPTDAARGANLAFAAEALAASDCGVDQFLPYSVSGTERDGEKLTEAYMGLFRPATGAPTLTAEALFRAAARWRARFGPGGAGVGERLALCSGGPSPAAAMLPIATEYTGAAPGCVNVRATYDGGPLEAATLALSTAGRQTVVQALTNADGRATACVPAPVPADDFRATVVLSKAGLGGGVYCHVRGLGCPPGVVMQPAPGLEVSAPAVTGQPATRTPAPTPVPLAGSAGDPGQCTWQSTTRQVRFVAGRGRKPAKATLAATVRCGSVPRGEAYRFAVYVRVKNSKRLRKVRTISMRNEVERRFTLTGPYRDGHRIVVTYREAPNRGIPQLRDKLTLRVAKPRRAQR